MPNYGYGLPKPKPPTKPDTNTFNSEADRKEGVVTTLNVTVPHSAYFFSTRPLDIMFEQTILRRPYTVEKVKIFGGAGKVTQLELGLRATDDSTGLPPQLTTTADFWNTVL